MNILKPFTLLILFFFYSSSSLFSQKILIQGQVQLEDGEYAYGALVTLQDSLYTVLNAKGEFFIESNEVLKLLRFSISFLGYETLDTIIYKKNISRFDFVLKKRIFETPEVVVMDKRELNLFKKANWTILDMLIYDKSFFLIAIDKGKRYLFQYNMDGVFLRKQKMGKINSFYVSCFGSLYVKSNFRYFQLLIDDKIKIIAKMTLSEFDEKLKPCVAFYKSKVICEFLSHHNKMKKYVQIWNNGERKTIASIFDKSAEKVARSYYYEIIRAYHRAVSNPKKESISFGIEQPNLVEDGSWGGDLEKLIIDNKTHEMVSYYQSIESNPIHVVVFFYQQKLYILDYVNQEFSFFDAKNDFTKEKINLNFDWDIKLKVLILKQGEVACFYSNNNIYEMREKGNGVRFVKTIDIPDELFYKKIVGMNGRFVYVTGRKYKNVPRMIVKRYEVN